MRYSHVTVSLDRQKLYSALFLLRSPQVDSQQVSFKESLTSKGWWDGLVRHVLAMKPEVLNSDLLHARCDGLCL